VNLRFATDVNSPAVIAVAAILTAVGIVFFNAMPLVLGTAAEQLGFNNQQIGFIASSFMAGFTSMSVVLIVVVRRLNWRYSCAFFAILQAVSFVVATQTGHLGTLLGILFVAGLAGGGLFGIATISLVDTHYPDRNIGIGTFAQVSMPALIVLLLPIAVIPKWGFGGLMVTLALLPAVTLVLLPWVVRRSNKVEKAHSNSGAQIQSAAVFPALAGALIFHTAAAATWAFYERVGDANGVAPETVGAVLSVALLASGAGSLVPVFLHARTGRLVPILAAAILQLGSLASLIVAPEASYLVAGPIFMFAWTVSIIFQLGNVAALDISGRYSVAIPAVVGVAAIIGPTLGGALVSDNDFSRLLLAACVLIVLSVLLAGFANRKPATAVPAAE
jgi:predicted MFS family arabinose efflux permease